MGQTRKIAFLSPLSLDCLLCGFGGSRRSAFPEHLNKPFNHTRNSRTILELLLGRPLRPSPSQLGSQVSAQPDIGTVLQLGTLHVAVLGHSQWLLSQNKETPKNSTSGPRLDPKFGIQGYNLLSAGISRICVRADFSEYRKCERRTSNLAQSLCQFKLS